MFTVSSWSTSQLNPSGGPPSEGTPSPKERTWAWTVTELNRTYLRRRQKEMRIQQMKWIKKKLKKKISAKVESFDS